MKLIAVAILVIWFGLAILGFLVKGLLWLAIVAIVLFIATAIWAWTRGRHPTGPVRRMAFPQGERHLARAARPALMQCRP